MNSVILALLLMFSSHRSPEVRRQFMHLHPCPSTHKKYGSCPGFVVDHVVPLACGGGDSVSNMAWQTVEAGKAKDRWERKGCPVTLVGPGNAGSTFGSWCEDKNGKPVDCFKN